MNEFFSKSDLEELLDLARQLHNCVTFKDMDMDEFMQTLNLCFRPAAERVMQEFKVAVVEEPTVLIPRCVELRLIDIVPFILNRRVRLKNVYCPLCEMDTIWAEPLYCCICDRTFTHWRKEK